MRLCIYVALRIYRFDLYKEKRYIYIYVCIEYIGGKTMEEEIETYDEDDFGLSENDSDNFSWWGINEIGW